MATKFKQIEGIFTFITSPFNHELEPHQTKGKQVCARVQLQNRVKHTKKKKE